jgi:hypothetical protein
LTQLTCLHGRILNATVRFFQMAGVLMMKVIVFQTKAQETTVTIKLNMIHGELDISSGRNKYETIDKQTRI